MEHRCTVQPEPMGEARNGELKGIHGDYLVRARHLAQVGCRLERMGCEWWISRLEGRPLRPSIRRGTGQGWSLLSPDIFSAVRKGKPKRKNAGGLRDWCGFFASTPP